MPAMKVLKITLITLLILIVLAVIVGVFRQIPTPIGKSKVQRKIANAAGSLSLL